MFFAFGQEKMEKEKFIEEAAECIEQYLKKPSRVTRNKNDKTISVSHAFDLGLIPLTIIAKYEVWKELEEKYQEDSCLIDIEDIKPYIDRRTSSEKIEALEKYYNQSRLEFEDHFYFYYIEPSKNPLVTKPPRGGSPYPIKPSEMWKVKNTARHLYVFLTHWLQKPRSQRPFLLREYLRKHEIVTDKPIIVTMEIVEKLFSLGISEIEDTKTFYDKYIAFQSLDHLKKAYKKMNYQPFGKPLLGIFPNN